MRGIVEIFSYNSLNYICLFPGEIKCSKTEGKSINQTICQKQHTQK